MRLDHPIFHVPLETKLDWSEIATPENYRNWPGGRDLPARMKVWRVHDGEFPAIDVGMVSDPFGYEDSPDCEWISSGVNSKGPNSVALGRVGNFFHWGFFGDPSLMTESGKRVFVNTICWMKQFDGQRPILPAKASQSRDWAFVYVGYIRELGDRDTTFTSHGPDGEKKQTAQEFLRTLFPAEVLAAAGQGEGKLDADKVEAYYREHLEQLVSGQKGLVVDADVVELGVSNRTPEILDRLAERLTTDPKDALALRCVERYLDLPKPKPDVVAWIRANRDRLYFSDVGGFKWRLPPDKLVPRAPRAETPVEPSAAKPVVATASVEPAKLAPGATAKLVVHVRTAPTWHIYPREATGTPNAKAELTPTLPAGLATAGDWIDPESHPDAISRIAILEGAFDFALPIRVADDAVSGRRKLRCKLAYQCCDPFMCRPPESLEVECEVVIAVQ